MLKESKDASHTDERVGSRNQSSVNSVARRHPESEAKKRKLYALTRCPGHLCIV